MKKDCEHKNTKHFPFFVAKYICMLRPRFKLWSAIGGNS